MSKKLSGYLPALILFCIALLVGLLTYQEYSISWDEPEQRLGGIMTYDYVFHCDRTLIDTPSDYHGAAFEFFLAIIERVMNITKQRDVYLMRHLVSHIVFLLGALSLSMLSFRLFGSRFLSVLCFAMLLCMPRIYAHSFFNSKDVPFLAMIAIALSYTQIAFSKGRLMPFFILGLICGFATGIRIMGIMFFCFVNFFLLADLLSSGDVKGRIGKALSSVLLFSAAFCAALYLSWPYLWRDPVGIFLTSAKLMAKYTWVGKVLFAGKMIPSDHLPWYYFPGWFSITTPVLWLVAGVTGLGVFVYEFIRSPRRYLKNVPGRNSLLSALCLAGPVLSVILLHSVIYDDWRHLYFVYPPFVLIALFFLDRALHTKYAPVVKFLCLAQVSVVGWFMAHNIHFNQVYFNELVSHKKEYLRKHYEMDYWGCGYKQALDYLLKLEPDADTIRIATNGIQSLLVKNNMMLLEERDSKRIKRVDPEFSDYFVTNFRSHPEDFEYPHVQYSIVVQNSTVLCIYKMH